MNAGICAGWRGLFRQATVAALVFTAGAWLTGAALGAEVAEVEFLVSVSDGEGNQRSIQADVVPYLPDRACFGWRLRLAGAPTLVRYREVLTLPEAPAFWTGEDDSYSPHKYSADRTTATTEEFAAPDKDGWISSHWCIAEGDPVGAHSIDVYIDDSLVRHFAFEVKKLGE
jgi:hypothetical protein